MRQRRYLIWLPVALVVTAALVWVLALRRVRSTGFDAAVDLGGGRMARVTVEYSRRPSYFDLPHVGSLMDFGGDRYELYVAGDGPRPSATFHIQRFPVAVWDENGELLVAATSGSDRTVYRIDPRSGKVGELHPASGHRPPSWNLLPPSEWPRMDQDFAESGRWDDR